MIDQQQVRLLLGLWTFTTLFLLAGCTTIKEAAGPEVFVVSKGMPVERLVQGLGEPDEVLPYGKGEVVSELWVYNKEQTRMKMISTDMEKVPYFDPVTGYQTTVLESVMSPEIAVSRTRTVFLVADGKVEAWKVLKDSNSYL